MSKPTQLNPNTDNRTLVSADHAAQRAAMKRAAVPRIASTIILVRGEKGAEEILVGLRSKKT